ncbi:MAG: hypothetical protein H0T89_36465 [Deltaproteobacteria bacterium]|nr:hypothetical protein [Deltaproteobacteria bacterium]MDQ3295166.1 hypothetical protein [Myxococcota bacterium]
MQTVTFVKKIKEDGSPCRKCAEVEERLQSAGLMPRIDRVVIADERDPASEGIQLAAELGVDAAPFFIVVKDGVQIVYTSYVRVLKEVLTAKTTEEEEAKEILERSDDLDFL